MTLTLEQRQARLSRVGASEVAALLEPSRHPFTDKRKIYARIMEGVESEPNSNMLVGQLMEPHVLDVARKLWRLRAFACTRAYIHPELPVCASPDAYIGDGQGLVEVKTTSGVWVDQPPDYVVAQVQCQLWLARRSYAHVVVLSGSRLELFTLERDWSLIDEIEAGVARFTIEHLMPGRPPDGPSHLFSLENVRNV